MFYLADAGHSGHSELCVTVQLQRSLAEEEVDLVVVPVFAAAALPDKGWAHKVWLCTHTTDTEGLSGRALLRHHQGTKQQSQPAGLMHTHTHTHTYSEAWHFYLFFCLPFLTSLSVFFHHFTSPVLQSFLTLFLSSANYQRFILRFPLPQSLLSFSDSFYIQASLGCECFFFKSRICFGL